MGSSILSLNYLPKTSDSSPITDLSYPSPSYHTYLLSPATSHWLSVSLATLLALLNSNPHHYGLVILLSRYMTCLIGAIYLPTEERDCFIEAEGQGCASIDNLGGATYLLDP